MHGASNEFTVTSMGEGSPAISMPSSSQANRLARPLVSIGLPVFNGERYLDRTLSSLLAQTVSDLELIISDNASTDDTQAICEKFARRDARVRYVRQPKNIGAPRNWNFVAYEARGEFFKWATASDLCAPNALERCVEILRMDPAIVLCYGYTQFIDERDHLLEIFGSDIDVGEDRPSERFARVCVMLKLNNMQSGVCRAQVLKRTRLDRLYPSGDMSLMAELALYGKIRLLPDVLLYRRKTRETFTSLLTPLERQRVYDPGASAPIRLIRLRRHLDHLVSIARAPISILEKLRSVQIALRLACVEKRRLLGEILSLVRR
jgi:glycosyltransferase involved in cell wall biosynthesis